MNGSTPLPIPPIGRKVTPEPKETSADEPEQLTPVAGKPHLRQDAQGRLRTVPSPVTPAPSDYQRPIKG